MQNVDRMLLHVAKVRTLAGDNCLTNATGFFFLQDDYLYLVTARHVVSNPAAGHHPDGLRVALHVDAADLRQTRELTIPLYVDGVPQWYQHPTRDDADVAAVAINDPSVMADHLVASFSARDLLTSEDSVALGQEVVILGFPLGFHDSVHNLPLARSAMIASSFAHPFKGQPCFLTDARLHRGMSGSPVIAKLPASRTDNDDTSDSWRLLGLHSAALDVSDRDPNLDERLALNMTYYATLIPELLPRPPVPPAAPH